MIPVTRLSDYTYQLPDERIAQFPLPERDQSKLLCYRKGIIDHHRFNGLPQLLDPGMLLVLNNTRVVPARLLFHRETGAQVEVFLLDPVAPHTLVSQAMVTRGWCRFQCMVGNLKKWKDGERLRLQVNDRLELEAVLYDREKMLVDLYWSPEHYTLSAVLEEAGKLPLPPYIQREADAHDRETYQTVYAQHNGAVAAPTAGLHFSDAVFRELEARHIEMDQVTLHVSAGTFQPVKTDEAHLHTMHNEQVIITRQNLEHWKKHMGHIVAVGTTSMRTLESAYWLGVKAMQGLPADSLSQEFAYTQHHVELPAADKAFDALIALMDRQETDTWHATTGIYIVPGYTFKVCRGLITNFHMPGTTLIMLVAAFIGKDWRKVYEEALHNGYRFLSYGDSSLLLP